MCLSHGLVMSEVYMSELKFYLSRTNGHRFWPTLQSGPKPRTHESRWKKKYAVSKISGFVWKGPKAACKRTQHCWPTTPNIVGCYMLRLFAHPVACCWELLRKVWNRSNFSANNSNISFVPWSPKRSATMLDPFAQLFQHCWGHARSLRMVYKDLWVVSFPRCSAGPNIVESCCIRLHPTAKTHATTTNLWRNNVGSCCVRLHAA